MASPVKRVHGGVLAVLTASLAVLMVPATGADASVPGGPANCQLAMASPRTSSHTVTAIVQVSCSTPVDLAVSGALWRAHDHGAQRMAVSSQTFKHSATARVSVAVACPGGAGTWMSTGNSSYTLRGVSYLLGGISARQNLVC